MFIVLGAKLGRRRGGRSFCCCRLAFSFSLGHGGLICLGRRIRSHPRFSGFRLADSPRYQGFTAGFETGQAILQVIEDGIARPPYSLPTPPERPERLPPGLGPLTDLLKVLLKLNCEKQNVAARLVASGDDLERIAADDNADVPALNGWRREIFGDQALALKHGKLALAADGKKIRVLPLD